MVARHLSIHAERACDDAVLRDTEATGYADQLVELAACRSAKCTPVLAMAGRHDLATRIGAVLDATQARGPAGSRWMMLAIGVAVLVLTTMSPLHVMAVARTPQAAATGAPLDSTTS
jgi:beta-lactamase regulating signal transducer with metallopeptidase domain